MSKTDVKLFAAHEHALEKEFETCPECGSELVIKNSQNGPFVGCANYPLCDYTRPLQQQSKIEKVLTGSSCPECSHELAIKHGRYGLFIGCTNFPDCHHIEQLEQPDNTQVTCPSCKNGKLLQRKSRYGKFFYACDAFPKCKYAVNHKPVASDCPDCGWSILVEKKTASGIKLMCPQKKCKYVGQDSV